MRNPRSIFRWIKIIGMLLISTLLYLVYCTDLGKPEKLETNKGVAIYGQTAGPTLFVESSKAPTVKLDWAYARQDILKFAISIHGLEIDAEPSDWICDPYITTEEAVHIQRRFPQSNFIYMYDNEGEFIQATYEYQVNAQAYSDLTIDLDLTIGPCADYLNFSETNVTPTVIPLIGNYRLKFKVPVQAITASPTAFARIPAPLVWKDIPIYPEAYQLTEEPTFYLYAVQEDPDKVESFYSEKMASDGWDLYNKVKAITDGQHEIDLYFSKAESIVTVQILLSLQDEPTRVSIFLGQ